MAFVGDRGNGSKKLRALPRQDPRLERSPVGLDDPPRLRQPLLLGRRHRVKKMKSGASPALRCLFVLPPRADTFRYARRGSRPGLVSRAGRPAFRKGPLKTLSAEGLNRVRSC